VANVPDLDLARVARCREERMPARVKYTIRLGGKVSGRSITIRERRPPWRLEMSGKTLRASHSVAQLRWDRHGLDWSLHRADQDGRWYLYDLMEPGTVNELLAEVEEDPTGIFWG